MALEWPAVFIIASFMVGLLASIGFAYKVLSIKVDGVGMEEHLIAAEGEAREVPVKKLLWIASKIEEGAQAFLFAEYRFIMAFLVVFMIVIGLLCRSWPTAFAFVWGGLTSLACGWIGMSIAVKTNVRVTHEAIRGYGPAFNAAFGGGAVMGFCLTSLGLMNLFILYYIMKAMVNPQNSDDYKIMWENIAGYGLGGSTMALFGRVGGGIYTKAADVGADLVGKVEAGIPEDDPRNPAVIADNVGDNVGDIAGMGSDLFGSFAEATCAALVVAANSPLSDGVTMLGEDTNGKWFPLAVSALGIFVCLATASIPYIIPVNKPSAIELHLKVQLIVSTVLMTPLLYLLSIYMLPDDFSILTTKTSNVKIFACVATGLWAGLIIGIITEYFTSHSYGPVREVADSCNTGAATNVIFGLSLGYKSVVIPVFALAITIWSGYHLGNQYGIAMAALGMLSTLSTGLAIDGYGPISDNAGGIAEMAELGEGIRERTDALDAAGNTTAAIGKGFAIGSAALVSLALFGAFTVRAGIGCKTGRDESCAGSNLNVQDPLVFAGLIVGVMYPYWFSAMTMKSVGIAAQAMVVEVRRQFADMPGIMNHTQQPDYKRCIDISTKASLFQMLPPGALVIFSPIIIGYFFGKTCLAGLLVGAMTSGVQVAISMSNTGGAWDNAKKYIEQGHHGGKHSDAHKAAVTGDTVGDPLKDTSGPSVNILMKLMAIISLVFADFFYEHGGLIPLE